MTPHKWETTKPKKKIEGLNSKKLKDNIEWFVKKPFLMEPQKNIKIILEIFRPRWETFKKKYILGFLPPFF